MAKNNTWAIILGIAAVAGGAYLLTRGKGEDGEDGGGVLPRLELPDISVPTMPQFNLPSMPQFNLPSMPQFSMPQMSLPAVPKIPQVLPDIMPSVSGADGDGIVPKILDFFGAVDKVIDPGSLLRKSHVTTIEAGTVEIAGEEWLKVPQYPGYQMSTKDFLLSGWKNMFINPIDTISDLIKYGSPVVKTIKTSDPAAVASTSSETAPSSSIFDKPLYLPPGIRVTAPITKPDYSYPQPAESAAQLESKPQPESAPYEQFHTGIYIIPLEKKIEAAKIIGDSDEFSKWLSDQGAGDFYEPESPPPAVCCGCG